MHSPCHKMAELMTINMAQVLINIFISVFNDNFSSCTPQALKLKREWGNEVSLITR